MRQTKIESIVAEFRQNVCDISDEEVAEVVSLCIQKIKLIGQTEEYMELLLLDELKNHVFRKAVNATTTLRQVGRRCAECVAYV